MSTLQRKAKAKENAAPQQQPQPAAAQRAVQPEQAHAPAGKQNAQPAFGLGGAVQKKAVINEPGDMYEKQAEEAGELAAEGEQLQPGALSPLAAGGLPQAQRASQTDDKRQKADVQKAAQPGKEKQQPVQKAEQPTDNRQPATVQKAAPAGKEKEQPVQKAAQPGKEQQQPVQKAAQPAEKQPVAQKAAPAGKEKGQPVQQATQPGKDKQQQVQKAEQPTENRQPATVNRQQAPVQRSAAPHASEAGADAASAADQAIASRGPGKPLEAATRSGLEDSLGADLSRVRVHDDHNAQQAAAAMGARAFTHQNDIWLGKGESPKDTRLMGHEAAHVVQQSAASSAQPRVQRAVDPGGGGDAGATGDLKTGLLDEAGKRITFDKIGIPKFKKKDHRGVAYDQHKPLIYKANYDRGNPDQREKWRKSLNKENIKKKLEEKASTAKGGKAGKGQDSYVFTVPTKGGKPYMIGSLDEIAADMTIPYWGGKAKNPPTRLFQVDHIVELQLADWNGKEGWGNELDNMELLEKSANQSSGSIIAGNIKEKVSGYLAAQAKAEKDKKEAESPSEDSGKKKKKDKKKDKKSKAAIEAVKAKYSLVFNDAVGEAGPSVDQTEFWQRKDIEAGEHLGAVKASNLDEMGGKGAVLLFPRKSGGLAKRFAWKEKDTGDKKATSEEKNWLRPFTITNKSFQTTGDDVEATPQLGSLTIEIPDGDKHWKPYPAETVTVHRLPGAAFAGYLDVYDVRSRAEKIQQKQTSPIQFGEFDIDPDHGLVARGQVLPDVPLIKDIGLEFTMRGNDFTLFKRFNIGEFKVPKPLTVSDSSLILFASTERGLGAEGEIQFGIEKLGEGYLAGEASMAGGLALEGAFNFDSKLFDPAEISMEYKDGEFGLAGKLGIPEGKVKGIKSADFAASYKKGVFEFTGSAELNVPAVEKADVAMRYSEAEGMEITGSFELKKNLPGLKSGGGEVRLVKKPASDAWQVFAKGKAEPNIPGFTTQLEAVYEDGVFTAQITAGYEKGMLKGTITVGVTNRPVDASGQPGGEATDKFTAFGGGSVTVRLTPWLQGTIAVRLLPNGEVEVYGEIGLPGTVNITPEPKTLDKKLFETPPIDIPILGFSVLGKRVGVFASIAGGLNLKASVGPVQLTELKLGVKYNPDHEDQTTVTGGAKLHIPASAGLRLYIKGSIGASLLIVTAQGGIELGGMIGLEGALDAGITVNWSPAKGLVLDAFGSVYVQPKLRFDITAFVEVEADYFFGTKTLYDKRWELAAYEFGPNLRFGMKLPVHYEEGKPFDVSWSDVQFETPQISVKSLLTDLVKEIV